MLSQVTHSLASALAKDPLSDYKTSGAHFRGGKNDLWHIQDAVELSTGHLVSILSLDVREVTARCPSATEAGDVLEQFRAAVSLLTRLRHPCLLRVVRPLVEDGRALRLVTDRVAAALPPRLAAGVGPQERLLGLQRCASAVAFLRARVGHVVGDLSPAALCVAGGEWCLFDLTRAAPPADAVWPHPFGSPAAPRLDYLAPECVAAGRAVPDGDVFAFLLLAAEVMGGRPLLRCEDDAARHAAQCAAAAAELEAHFPFLRRAPRPDFGAVLREAPFAAPALRLLAELEAYDTLDDAARFRLLKGLYDAIGRGELAESVVLRRVIPVMRRDSAEERLRYTLPILLQCCASVSGAAFDAHLRDYFASFLRGVGAATTLERCAALAEIVLDKFALLARHLVTEADRNNLVVPFLERCLHARGPHARLGRLSAERLARLAENGAIRLADTTPTHLIDNGLADPPMCAEAFQCLESALRFATPAARALAEEHLARGIRTTESADIIPHALRMLERIQHGFSSDHRATRSIPLLAPLLLSSAREVAAFSRRTIEMIVAEVVPHGAFAPVPASSAPPPPPPAPFQAQVDWSDFLFSDSKPSLSSV